MLLLGAGQWDNNPSCIGCGRLVLGSTRSSVVDAGTSAGAAMGIVRPLALGRSSACAVGFNVGALSAGRRVVDLPFLRC
jgi:hypothetical protein